MNSDSDFKMSVSNTFSCILAEIQLSNLNYSIHMTPFAANITLKKSTQKDQNGVHLPPSPPLLHLLQQAQQEINHLKEEQRRSEARNQLLKTKCENLALENATNIEAFSEANDALVKSKVRNDELLKKVENLEKKATKTTTEKEDIENKLKETKTKLGCEVSKLKVRIKSAEKSKKSLEKENFDVNRNLINARDTIKNMKSEKLQLKISKSKLKSEMRKIEKNLNKKHSQVIAKEEFKNPTKLICSEENSRMFTTIPSLSPTMISHVIPLYSKNQTSSLSMTSMYAHCVFKSSYTSDPAENYTREDLTELVKEIREQFKSDTAKIIAEMRIDLSQIFNREFLDV